MQITQARRGDIQGLRALAVLLVVAGHLYPSIIPGGFIGVDIFFVISGFVITQQMIGLKEKFPNSFLSAFYARRIRRILPSASLVLIVTYIATKHYVGIVAANDFTLDGFWATLFLSNLHFQSQALNYFAAGIQASPIQHFWSLSIEEQFYLLWPALFLIFGYLKISRRNLRVFLVGIISISLLSSIYASEANKSAIFFNTFPRVWELGAGAFCALITWKKSSKIYLELIIIATYMGAAFTIHQSMQWPRLTAFPVVGLTCLLLARAVPQKATTALNNPITRYIGDLSYLIYLWHWPVLTIVKSTNSAFDAKQVILVLVVTAILSVTTHHIFENPIRHSDFFLARPLITISTSLSVIATVAIAFYMIHQG